MSKKLIKLFTDGSCLGNPGPGGYSAILYYKNYKKILTSGFYLTTNNRMELMANIIGLEALIEPCKVSIFTDSKYVKQGIQKWIKIWEKSGWLTSRKKKIKNIDLWKRLQLVVDLHEVNWFWIKSHSGNKYNNLCDLIAKKSAKKPIHKDILYKRKI